MKLLVVLLGLAGRLALADNCSDCFSQTANAFCPSTNPPAESDGRCAHNTDFCANALITNIRACPAIMEKDTEPFPSIDCASPPQNAFPFCDPTLDFETRVDDLVSRMTLEDKIAQTTSEASAIPDLGINVYNYRSNCLHGWSLSGGDWGDLTWTTFPAPIGLAAGFKPHRVLDVAGVAGTEGRALHNLQLQRFEGVSTEASGLNCFAPNINIFRDPRWGRGQETYGEDPYLTSSFAIAYINGLQKGLDRNIEHKYLLVSGCAKHFMAHNGPDDNPIRLGFVTNVTVHDLFDTFAKAFEISAKCTDVGEFMPSYSGLLNTASPDGAPDCANPFLLQTLLREKWGRPNVHIISDNGGVDNVFEFHHFADSLEEAAADTLLASTDMDLGPDHVLDSQLPAALQDGLVTEDELDEAVKRTMLLRMKLGEFDPFDQVFFRHLGAEDIDNDHHFSINMAATHESMVLLKNEKKMLPLSIDTKRIAVIGPNADSLFAQLSNYEGIPSLTFTVVEGIRLALPDATITLDEACDGPFCPTSDDFDSAIQNAQAAEVAILVMGLDDTVEREGMDRRTGPCDGVDPDDILHLPGCQDKLIQAIVDTGTPTVLVMVNGGPVAINNADESVPAILEAFYPGSLGGVAVADVLFGKYNPGGKLPFTVFRDTSDMSPLDDYQMIPDDTHNGRTYRYYTGDNVLYRFGYGLSYTTFQYTSLTINAPRTGCGSVHIKVDVTNTGDVGGDEVVQVYVTAPDKQGPNHSLQEFKRIHVHPGDTQMVEFDLFSYQLSLILEDESGDRFNPEGLFTISVGGHQPGDTRGDLISNVLTGTVNVSGLRDADECDICRAFPVQN